MLDPDVPVPEFLNPLHNVSLNGLSDKVLTSFVGDVLLVLPSVAPALQVAWRVLSILTSSDIGFLNATISRHLRLGAPRRARTAQDAGGGPRSSRDAPYQVKTDILRCLTGSTRSKIG